MGTNFIPPPHALPLPEGTIFLGKGNTFLPNSTGFLKCPKKPLDLFGGWLYIGGEWVSRTNDLNGLCKAAFYAVPYDSEIAKLNGFPEIPDGFRFAGWTPGSVRNLTGRVGMSIDGSFRKFASLTYRTYSGNGSAYYFTGPEEQSEWVIHYDGSVNCNGIHVRAEEVERFYKWAESAPPVAGFTTYFNKITIGCQTLYSNDIYDFIRQYRAEKWKELFIADLTEKPDIIFEKEVYP